MRYLEVRTQLIEHVSAGGPEIVIPKEAFLHLLKAAIANVRFDELWYLEKYEDVQSALALKLLSSAKQHYLLYGYFEDRLPYAIKVDEKFYLAENPDVREAVESGAFKDGQEHFDLHGFAEGREPYQGFQLF
ncbi:hypothetical protein [Methylosinus sp. RM1]|uniref:hypothetical protein n=1 Tax=Methylosinus sp. RM1 TaxID=2583817 RepID=UPI00140E899D|nr:hypothetical protein [Methylosinus sp. RM1]